MHVLTLLTVLLLPLTLGDDTQPVKVLFFGDSVVSGLHNNNADVCPFRYDFLRGLKAEGKDVTVIGTNTDKKGSCQKVGEELSLHNNGYQNAVIDELLDYITADLQYLYDPVDYIFTSIGLQDCLRWEEGRDFQILSQSVRRIMGRLLNLNENAKIYHIPVLLPPSAGKAAVDCMDFVNQKLRDVYYPEKNGRIRVVDPLQGTTLTDVMFYKIGGKKDTKPVVPPADPPMSTRVNKAPAATEQATVAKVPDAHAPEQPEAGETRRFSTQPLEYLPNQKLTKMIAEELLKTLDWEFRAQTPPPTMEVTKEPDYYGYDWCKNKYAEDECFEYYYGYVWCLQEYSEEECYSYYYGDVETWEEGDNYKWCMNFYDEEYCSFAYKGEEPDTWDWLSFGYHDCLKVMDSNNCFEQYYGYAWCVNEYADSECYEYYYGSDEWTWDEDSSYKWCLNFYTEDDCKVRYSGGVITMATTTEESGVSLTKVGIIATVITGVLVWLCYKKINCFESKEYSRLNTRYAGGEDEMELL